MPSYITAPNLARLLTAASPPPPPAPKHFANGRLPTAKRSPSSTTTANPSPQPPANSSPQPPSSSPPATESTPPLSPVPTPTLAIIDVRDSDHVGGHIRTSLHYPSSTLDATMPELVRKLWDMDVVVFHCALSQQRGPRAARGYEGLRGRWWEAGKGPNGAVRKGEDVAKEGGHGRGGKSEEEGEEDEGAGRDQQKVYILDGGFVKWMEKYGRDPAMTIDFAPDIWVDYF